MTDHSALKSKPQISSSETATIADLCFQVVAEVVQKGNRQGKGRHGKRIFRNTNGSPAKNNF